MTADFPSKKDSKDENSNMEKMENEETQNITTDNSEEAREESSLSYPFGQDSLKNDEKNDEKNNNDKEEKHLGAFLKNQSQKEQEELTTKAPAADISSSLDKTDSKKLNGKDTQNSKADLSDKSKANKGGFFSKKAKKESTPKQGIYTERPILTVPSDMPASLSSRLFNFMAYLPWLFLTLFIIGQTIFSLDVRALWFSDEVRHAGAFTEMLSNGKIFALELNGNLYPDKPPLYFWFLYLLYDLIKINGPLLYFSAAALSAILYLWASLALGRFVGRFDGRTLLASGIILFTTAYIAGLMHYARMDFLFSSLILVSHVFFFIACSKEKSKTHMILAFTFAALACLTKGPLGLAFPLATALFFLIWQGRIKRLFSKDFIIGLLVALFIIGGWLLGLYLETNLDYIKNEIFSGQVVQRAIDARHHAQGWTYYLVRLPLLILPWLAILFCLPYHKLFSKNALSRIKDSRSSKADGLSYLWCMMLSGILLLSLISTKILIYMLPVLPAMALLAGRAVLQMAGKRAFVFRVLTCLLMLIAGAILLYCSLAMAGILPLISSAKIPAWEINFNLGFVIAAVILLVCGLALWLLLRSSRPEGVLIIMAISALAASYPLYKMAMPSLDTVMSPKAQGEIIKAHVKDGFYPVTFGLYGGTYTYYAGQSLDKISDLNEFSTLSQSKDKIILAIRDKDYSKWENKTEGLKEINRQWIESNEYILLSWEKAVLDADTDSSTNDDAGATDGASNSEPNDTSDTTDHNATDSDASNVGTNGASDANDSTKNSTESAPDQDTFENKNSDMGKKPAEGAENIEDIGNIEDESPLLAPAQAEEEYKVNKITPETESNSNESLPEAKNDTALNSGDKSETPSENNAETKADEKTIPLQEAE